MGGEYGEVFVNTTGTVRDPNTTPRPLSERRARPERAEARRIQAPRRTLKCLREVDPGTARDLDVPSKGGQEERAEPGSASEERSGGCA